MGVQWIIVWGKLMLCRQGSTSGKLFRSNYCAISARIAEFDFERATSTNAQRTSSQALHCLNSCIPRHGVVVLPAAAWPRWRKPQWLDSMEEDHSWEAVSSSAIHEIPRILWNPKFARARHYTLSWARSIHPSWFLKIHFYILFPSVPGCFKYSLLLRFHHHNTAVVHANV